MSDITILQKQLEPMDALERIRTILGMYKESRLTFATSFGAEDQVITDMIASINPNVRLFTLDTGRQFQQTYDIMHKTALHYGITIEPYAPLTSDVEELVKKHGPNGMYDGLDKRKECCRIRKLKPLQRALSTVDAWICGIRQEQSVTRFNVHAAEWDSLHNIIKFAPLFDWSNDDVWKYIRAKNIPYHSLHDSGFPSVGCAPCTRSVGAGEDFRAGRWWWELSEQKECGLHKR